MSETTAKIYVGNLSYDTTKEGLIEFFEKYGEIIDARVITDRETGRSKGFGFVTFSSDAEGEAALAANKEELDGRSLNVNTANDKPKSSGPRDNGYGGGYNRR